jgi:RNA polymerase sigma-70 factor (ECF subfamily)
VRSAALDLGRGNSRRQRREQSRAQADCTQQAEPWQQAARDESDQRLRESLDQLPQQQREILVLKIWGGLTFDQIAEATESPRSTSAARYTAAIKSLRVALPEEEALR